VLIDLYKGWLRETDHWIVVGVKVCMERLIPGGMLVDPMKWQF